MISDPDVTVLLGDARAQLATLPSESVQCIVTSPPFWGLRDYGTATWSGGDPECDHLGPPMRTKASLAASAHSTRGGANHVDREPVPGDCPRCGAVRVDQQIGLEETPDEWCAKLVAVMREARRVLRSDGVCWIEVGDTYARGRSGRDDGGLTTVGRDAGWVPTGPASSLERSAPDGYKPKDLVGAPWKLAEALKAPYYTGEIKAERDRIWLGAIIDTEGSISAYRHERKDGDGIRTGCHVTITNTCAALLDEAMRIWPASKINHDGRDGSYGSRECWRWVATNVDRNALLMRELYPHLIAKRRQAMLAYNLFELSRDAKRLARTAQADSVRDKRDWIVANLSRLNQGLDVDVPAWILEPPSCFEPGWYLRSDTIWARPNPMPESVTDRPTKAHSYVFLLTKSARYFYDADAIRETSIRGGESPGGNRQGVDEFKVNGGWAHGEVPAARNARSVWSIPTQPTPFAHFATFPEELARRCIAAGTSEHGACSECGAPWRRVTDREVRNESGSGRSGNPPSGKNGHGFQGGSTGDVRNGPTVRVRMIGWESSCDHDAPVTPCVVLDPFMGSGTTALVARKMGRRAVGIELNPDYLEIARGRLAQQSLFA